jgi:hypothetical protein
VSLLALLGVLVLGAFPVRAYLDQLAEREELAARSQVLRERNRELAGHAQHLESDDAIERLARERYQLVRPGEEAYAILPVEEPPPAGEAEVQEPAGAQSSEPSRPWWARAWGRVTSLFRF